MEGSPGLMPIEEIFKLLGTYGFPTVLSVYPIVRLDFFLKETVKTNKILAGTISTDMKGISTGITDIKNTLATQNLSIK